MSVFATVCKSAAATAVLSLLAACGSTPSEPPKPRLTTEQLAAFELEERKLYGAGGPVPRGIRPYDGSLSNYAQYRGPKVVGEERMRHVAPPYWHVQIHLKTGAKAEQVTRFGTYAAQVRDVTIYPMTLRASVRDVDTLSVAVQRLCGATTKEYRPASAGVVRTLGEIDEFLEERLGEDGPKMWRHGSPSVPSCRLMDFGG